MFRWPALGPTVNSTTVGSWNEVKFLMAKEWIIIANNRQDFAEV
jgi:hypothetical protein